MINKYLDGGASAPMGSSIATPLGDYMENFTIGIHHMKNTTVSLQTTNTNLALSVSSSSSGFPLVTITPRFILAGSKAQFEMPIKATLFSRSII